MSYWLYPILVGLVSALVLAPPVFGLILLIVGGLGKLFFPNEFQPGWLMWLIRDLRRQGR